MLGLFCCIFACSLCFEVYAASRFVPGSGLQVDYVSDLDDAFLDFLVSGHHPSVYTGLTPLNTQMLFSDNGQAGLRSLVKDIPLNEYDNAVFAYIDMIAPYRIPVTVSTSAQSIPPGCMTAPNGPIMPVYKDALNASLLPVGLKECVNYFPRTGVINIALYPPALKRMLILKHFEGRNNIIINGIVTDVCVAEPALTLKSLGFNVYVAVDASGTTSDLQANAAVIRMSQQGIIPITWFAVGCLFQGNWLDPHLPANNSVPFEPLLGIVRKHYPEYENMVVQVFGTPDADAHCVP